MRLRTGLLVMIAMVAGLTALAPPASACDEFCVIRRSCPRCGSSGNSWCHVICTDRFSVCTQVECHAPETGDQKNASLDSLFAEKPTAGCSTQGGDQAEQRIVGVEVREVASRT